MRQPPRRITEDELAALNDVAAEACDLLKSVAHEGRLMILCHLAAAGERSVTELERALAQRQSAVSQQLARLRYEGLVEARREGKTIYYRLTDPRVLHLLQTVLTLFGEPAGVRAAADAAFDPGQKPAVQGG